MDVVDKGLIEFNETIIEIHCNRYPANEDDVNEFIELVCNKLPKKIDAFYSEIRANLLKMNSYKQMLYYFNNIKGQWKQNEGLLEGWLYRKENPSVKYHIHRKIDRINKMFDRVEAELRDKPELGAPQRSPKKSLHSEYPKEYELPERFELLFCSISKYKYVMKLLGDKGLVYHNTYIWKDETKGNKACLAALIKDWHGKKYYKGNTRPTNEQIKETCKIFFGLDVSIDTIKRTKANDFEFSFIPIASTID